MLCRGARRRAAGKGRVTHTNFGQLVITRNEWNFINRFTCYYSFSCGRASSMAKYPLTLIRWMMSAASHPPPRSHSHQENIPPLSCRGCMSTTCATTHIVIGSTAVVVGGRHHLPIHTMIYTLHPQVSDAAHMFLRGHSLRPINSGIIEGYTSYWLDTWGGIPENRFDPDLYIHSVLDIDQTRNRGRQEGSGVQISRKQYWDVKFMGR